MSRERLGVSAACVRAAQAWENPSRRVEPRRGWRRARVARHLCGPLPAVGSGARTGLAAQLEVTATVVCTWFCTRICSWTCACACACVCVCMVPAAGAPLLPQLCKVAPAFSADPALRNPVRNSVNNSVRSQQLSSQQPAAKCQQPNAKCHDSSASSQRPAAKQSAGESQYVTQPVSNTPHLRRAS